MRVLEYIHRPNKTEVGVGTNTNDSYLKLAPAIETSPIFTMNTEEFFYNAEYHRNCLFKAVKYTSGEMIFRRIETGEETIKQLDVIHYNKTMAYSSSKGKYTLVYPERLPNWNVEGTSFYAIFKGTQCEIVISFLENRHKRSDSPDETALYSITIGENIFNGSTLYINLEGSMPILEEKSKWQLNEFKIDTK